jgi:hypothetical protein
MRCVTNPDSHQVPHIVDCDGRGIWFPFRYLSSSSGSAQESHRSRSYSTGKFGFGEGLNKQIYRLHMPANSSGLVICLYGGKHKCKDGSFGNHQIESERRKLTGNLCPDMRSRVMLCLVYSHLVTVCSLLQVLEHCLTLVMVWLAFRMTQSM